MFYVKLRYEPYDHGKLFTFTFLAQATSFIESAMLHAKPDHDDNPLVAELWEDDTDNDTRKPNDEEEQP